MTADPHAYLTDAVLRPVRGHHAFEACVEQLGTAIRLGVYPRGTLLPPERELAERLTVSRATLREAIAALREAGMVETRRGRGGGTVVTLSAKAPSARRARKATEAQRADWRDALEFRRIVEPGAAYLAAQAELTSAQRSQLGVAHEAVATASNRAEHRQADSRYHLTIAALSGSARTIDAVTAAQASLHEMLSAIPVLGTNIAHSDLHHRDIYHAILEGKADDARQMMEDHCDDTAALLFGLLT